VTDYDAIATEYQESKLQPWRSVLEAPSLWKLAGQLAGSSVVDLACGEGYYTRTAKRQGASRVVGFDLSHGMIELARSQETAQPLGIDYQVADCAALEPAERFDLAMAAYLLNYARSEAELTAMCRSIARCLRPDGRFVTVNSSPFIDLATAPSFRSYGFELHPLGEFGADGLLPEGTPVRWKFYLDHETFEIENYILTPATHERAFAAAGFRQVRWIAAEVNAAAAARYPAISWNTFLTAPPIVLLEAVL